VIRHGVSNDHVNHSGSNDYVKHGGSLNVAYTTQTVDPPQENRKSDVGFRFFEGALAVWMV
jgi:hypothetical protein